MDVDTPVCTCVCMHVCRGGRYTFGVTLTHAGVANTPLMRETKFRVCWVEMIKGNLGELRNRGQEGKQIGYSRVCEPNLSAFCFFFKQVYGKEIQNSYLFSLNWAVLPH